MSFPHKLERTNRAREQGWRDVLSAGGGGEVKVGVGFQHHFTAAVFPQLHFALGSVCNCLFFLPGILQQLLRILSFLVCI